MEAYEEAIDELKKLSCRDCIHQDSFCTYEPHGVIYCPYAIEKKDYVLSLSVGPYTLKELIELASQVKEGQRLAIVEKEIDKSQNRGRIYWEKRIRKAGFVKGVKK